MSNLRHQHHQPTLKLLRKINAQHVTPLSKATAEERRRGVIKTNRHIIAEGDEKIGTSRFGFTMVRNYRLHATKGWRSTREIKLA